MPGPAFGDEPVAAEAASPPARRTGAQLLRRLLSRPENKRRLTDKLVVPIGGELVLKVISNLVASSDDGTCFALDPRFTPGGLPHVIAGEKKGWGGATAQIADLIEALHRAELIELTEAGVTLPLPPMPDPPDRSAGDGGKRFEKTPGTRKGWMTDAQWSDWRRLNSAGYAAQKAGDVAASQQAREAMEAMRPLQRSMLLPVAGMRTPGLDIARHIDGDIRAPSEMARHFNSEIPASQFAAPAEISPDIGGSHAAAAASADIDKTVQAEAAASKPREAPAISAGGISISKSGSDIPAVDMLVADMVRRFGMGAEASADALPIVQGWLDRGATPELVGAVFAEKEPGHRQAQERGKPGIRTAGYFTPRIDREIAHQRRLAIPGGPAAETGQAPAADAAPSDPRLRHLARGDRGFAERIIASLRAMEGEGGIPLDCPGPAAPAYRAASMARQYGRPAFDLVVTLYPQVAAWFGDTAPGERGVRPGGDVTP